MNEKEPTSLEQDSRKTLNGLRNDIERKSLSTFLHKLDQEIFSKMKYDDLNYSLAYRFDEESDINRALSRIPKNNRLLGGNHKQLLLKTLIGYAHKEQYDTLSIQEIIASIEETGYADILIQYPSLQQLLMHDTEFASAYDGLYRDKTLQEKIQMGVGNCNTFTDMAIELLDSKEQKKKLGIQSIHRVNNPTIDHTFLIIKTTRGEVISYDPTLALMKK